ncbi:type II secretion system GspH family protein [Paraglaciecola aquimarina]|uniref:Type II secretion system GspH family protein n=1 Tax=Paraglaciecola algarum TaxID=3050085 RepID=A0ABS9D6C0_9ALTE|nr:type II secretion system protein [Paraglaciecola sp. G1-23]MCF2948440.1 type II secretion system GspH family protein [Paraglaciecola sp. G1-23]
MRSKSFVQGFTLIEVLIALVIMSSVIALSVGAFRLFQPANLPDSEKLTEKSIRLIQYKKVSRSIRSALHYNFNSENGDNYLAFFGNNGYLLFITSNPVFSGHKLAIAILNKVVSPINGLVSLSYCEHPLGSLNLNYIETERLTCKGRDTIRYLSDLRQIDFEYFGWENRGVYFQTQSDWFSNRIKHEPKWWENFSAIDRQLLPYFIKIKIRKSNTEERLSELFIRLNEEDPRLAALSASSTLDG